MDLQRKMANELLKPLVEDMQDNPHRCALDTLVFDALNLTQVAARLQKASSLRELGCCTHSSIENLTVV